MKVVVVMQARTASSRLPGKALLPAAEFPSAVLAALRARNRGCELILATSEDRSDDVLAAEARSRGLQVFRGSLNDLLARFFYATRRLDEKDVVVRLTADNVLPDGDFIEQICSVFFASGAEYMSTDLSSGLPYGLAAEVFLVRALRRANELAVSEFDREHVGPWMQRNCASKIFVPKLPAGTNFNHLRCTIDDEEDYQRILRLFSGVSDPVSIGWLELVQKLSALPGEPTFRLPWKSVGGSLHSAMVLGTAQLGMSYGRVNNSGQPCRGDAVQIVRRAITHGVTSLDTARCYGESEAVLGDALVGAWSSRTQVVTKLDLSGTHELSSGAEVRRRVEASIQQSCEALRTRRLDVVLLHSWQHHDCWNGAAWERLCELQQNGNIGRIGVSVYEPREALEAVCDASVHHLQIPLNILDRRWKESGVNRAITQRPELIVHARSAFLQGILLHPVERWPCVAGFDSERCVRRLFQTANSFGRESIADLCLAYVRSLPWITSVVIGCETLEQLDENLRLFLNPKLTAAQVEEVESVFADAPEQLLNPSLWDQTPFPVAAYAG